MDKLVELLLGIDRELECFFDMTHIMRTRRIYVHSLLLHVKVLTIYEIASGQVTFANR